MRPNERVRSGPEFISEGVKIGTNHGFNACVNNTEGIIGPEIATNVGEMFILEEKFIAELAIKHKVDLFLV